MPHSHADIMVCLEKFSGVKRAVITLDCCVKNLIPDIQPLEYRDEDCISPHDTVRVWRNV